LAKLSSNVRKLNEAEHQEFAKTFVGTNYQVDQTRVPKLTQSKLSVEIRNTLERFGKLGGILP